MTTRDDEMTRDDVMILNDHVMIPNDHVVRTTRGRGNVRPKTTRMSGQKRRDCPTKNDENVHVGLDTWCVDDTWCVSANDKSPAAKCFRKFQASFPTPCPLENPSKSPTFDENFTKRLLGLL